MAAARSSATAGNQPIPSGLITQVPMTVSAATVGVVTSGFAGLAYPKEKILGNLFTGMDSSLITLFRLLGPSSLRLGGSTVDQSVWTPNGPGGQQGQVAPADVDNLAAFLKATNWTCIYGINLAGAATGATTPAMAAEEAAYVAARLGPALAAIEIGNEPDLYGRVGNPFANSWSLDDFIALWGEFRQAIVRLTPGIPIAGPVDGGNATTWTVPFAEIVTRQKISMITQHYYVASALAANATTAELLTLSLHRDLARNLAAIKVAADKIGVPFRMGECGSFYNNSGSAAPINVAGSYTAALWALDYMFMCAQGGMEGVNFEGGGDVPGYPPLLNDSDSVTAVCPIYYGLLLFQQAGAGPILQTAVSPGALNITAYALTTSPGVFSVLALNKEPAASIELQIQLPQAVTHASLTQMTQLSPGASAPDLLATSGVTIQSSTVQTDGAFAPGASYQLSPNGTQVTCFIPALSAVLIRAS
jgi:hypothetical protein